MCTTAAKLIDDSWFLIKTRDPVPWMRWDDEIKLFDTPIDKFRKLIIQNPDPNQDGYYGGINDQGVAFVATYVHVAENQISYIRRPYVRLILDTPTAQTAVKIIQLLNPRIGGNMFVADKTKAFLIEAAPDKYFVEPVKSWQVRTNHFLKLPHKNLSFSQVPGFKDWSINRQHRAEELVKKSAAVADLKAVLTDRANADKKTPICATGKERDCFTHSAFIFDTKKRKVHYAQGCPAEVPFKEYGFD